MVRPYLRIACIAVALMFGQGCVIGGEAALLATNSELENRMMGLAVELRCLVCQNQTIADSNAQLAVDLRQQIRELLQAGLSDRQILEYMTERYGDFVLYRPPFKATTLVLWVGPAVLLIVSVGGLVGVLRRRQRLGAEAFDPDPGEADADTFSTDNETNPNVQN